MVTYDVEDFISIKAMAQKEAQVVSSSLLEAVDTNKPLDPVFDIGMSQWLPEEYQARLKSSRPKRYSSDK